MKKLFTLLALSLVMVACNKEEDNELSYWDKVLSEMGETKLSALDVLQSLRDNEEWEIKTQYSYFLRDGKVVEEITRGDGIFVVGGNTATRFADDKMYAYSWSDPFTKGYSVYDIEKTDEGFKYYDEYGALGEWKIIGYDDNQILYEGYPLTEQEPAPLGVYLYSKVLRVRKVNDSKWWEELEPWK
jgi:hypothetical protein